MIIDYTNRDLSRLEHLITKNDGTPLQGEIDMYRRIVHDCEKSSIMWHFWHDIRLHITSGRAGEIQIDFLLICELGAIVIEHSPRWTVHRSSKLKITNGRLSTIKY